MVAELYAHITIFMDTARLTLKERKTAAVIYAKCQTVDCPNVHYSLVSVFLK